MNKKYCYKAFRSVLTALAILGAGSMLLSSCNDTLELPSYTKDDTDFAFRDENNADLFVKGIYSSLIHEEYYRSGNCAETTTQEAPDNLSSSGGKYGMSNYNYQPNTPICFDRIYLVGYNSIESCNVALSHLRAMEQTQKVKALIAEAVTLRAWVYYNLIRYFGDVPFLTQDFESTDTSDESLFYPARTSRDEIYDYVINEMVETIDDLPWQSECGWTERLTRNSAKGILARICLHAGGWSLRWEFNNPNAETRMARRPDENRITEIYRIADQALSEVIAKGENHLIQADAEMNGFYKLFWNFTHRNFGETDPEMMWSIAMLGQSVNSKYGIDVGSTGSTATPVFGQRKAMTLRLPQYYLSFDPADNRRDVTCGNYTIIGKTNRTDTEIINVGTTYSSVTPGKVRMQWATEPVTGQVAKRNVNIPMLRYSDILLMYAETQNYLNHGPNEAARSALKQVRQRAGVDHLPIPAGEQEFLKALLQERKWEFADECILRTDLVRMNLIAEEIEKSKQQLIDLSMRQGEYANIAVYRLYKYTEDANEYGSKFLTVDYIDLTDPDEAEQVKAVPTKAADYPDFQAKLQAIAAAHGKDATAEWYPCNMFEPWSSAYNKNSRKVVGIITTAIGIEAGIAGKYTGYAENKNKFPDWISSTISLYVWFKPNHSELSPFATNAPGKPLVDNPNLTQLPGYPGYSSGE
ncbi:MAG: RagB/SusD family nutrient uptake outer membrane protein [Muribaculaceae bacterium]|nr:RagB/SusD family nutrient uptake outer membrane protein [Muribaculaceae bacterium]